MLKKNSRRKDKRCWAYLPKETKRALIECLGHLYQALDTFSKTMDQIMSKFPLIQMFSLIFAEKLLKFLLIIIEIYDYFLVKIF